MRKNKGHILNCLAVVGIGASAYSWYKAGTKADYLLEQLDSDISNKEKTKIMVKTYAPPAIITAATAGVVIASDIIYQKEIKNLSNIISGLSTMSLSYVASLEEGVRVEPKKTKAPSDRCNEFDMDEVVLGLPQPDEADVIYTGNGLELFYDAYSKRWFRSNLAEVYTDMYHFNRNQILGWGNGGSSVNDWYEWIQIPKLDNGYELGWHRDWMLQQGIESCWIDIGVLRRGTDMGEIYYELYFMLDPERLDKCEEELYG